MRLKLSELEHKLGYKFNNTEILEKALSHTSLKQNKKEYKFDYEKLEFFGDAVLSLIITEKIYHSYNNFSEGELAKFRNYLISKNTIVKVAKKIDLGSYIIMSKGEENSGGKRKDNNIENAMEALLAGIYIDSGRKLSIVSKIALNIWLEFFDLYQESNEDPKGYLQVYSQGLKFPPPKYSIIKREGSPHAIKFTCEVSLQSGQKSLGVGSSIKEAQKIAAKNLIDFLAI